MAEMLDLTGKVAMVTGGNGGIGLSIAKGLATAGANIVIAAQDEAKTASAVEAVREHWAWMRWVWPWMWLTRTRWPRRCPLS